MGWRCSGLYIIACCPAVVVVWHVAAMSGADVVRETCEATHCIKPALVPQRAEPLCASLNHPETSSRILVALPRQQFAPARVLDGAHCWMSQLSLEVARHVRQVGVADWRCQLARVANLASSLPLPLHSLPADPQRSQPRSVSNGLVTSGRAAGNRLALGSDSPGFRCAVSSTMAMRCICACTTTPI